MGVIKDYLILSYYKTLVNIKIIGRADSHFSATLTSYSDHIKVDLQHWISAFKAQTAFVDVSIMLKKCNLEEKEKKLKI